jgi:foldase protein PrsA
LISTLALGLTGQGGDVVVTVNGFDIKSSDYVHKMEHLGGVFTRLNDSMVEVPPGLVTLDRMITERLMLQLANEHGVAPTAADVDSAYQAEIAANPSMEHDAIAAGRTVDDLKNDIRISLARYHLMTEGVIVTDEEVASQYKLNPDRYRSTETVTVRIIVVDNGADQSAVDSDLAAGKDFGDVAKAHSMDLSRLQGGLLENLPAASLDPSIVAALRAVKIGHATGWIKVPKQTDGGTLEEKLLFVSAVEPKPLPLDNNLKESIRRDLMYERGSVKNNLNKELDDELAKAKIDIKDPAFATAWAALRARVKDKNKPAG